MSAVAFPKLRTYLNPLPSPLPLPPNIISVNLFPSLFAPDTLPLRYTTSIIVVCSLNMMNMAEAKFVLYDLEKYKRDCGTRWILDTYKRTSAVGGPLDLSQFDPDTAHILWKDQSPTWLRDGGVIFRAFRVKGDSVPPMFVLGIVIKEKLDLEVRVCSPKSIG